MAEKKEEKKASVEERLKSLYQLQRILSEIDAIRLKRGELPLEVKDLEDNIEGLRTRIDNYTNEIKDLRLRTATEKEKVTRAQSLIAQYNEQIREVTNNKMYDSLSKEITYQGLEIELAEKHIAEYERLIDARQNEIEQTQQQLEEMNQVLAEKREELEQIISETRQQEDTLREEAKTHEAAIDERTLKAFQRIRRNARNGLGIASIQRDACGGCFNRVPPQRQMEIKMHKKIIVCEYCGRIMIDPGLAGLPVEEPATK